MSFPYGAWPHLVYRFSRNRERIKRTDSVLYPYSSILLPFVRYSLFLQLSSSVERVKVIYRDDDVSIREMDVVDIVI